jgi:hypothetical protein
MEGKDSIILMGPMLVGKSTIARMLWNKYLFEFINCDYYFDYYYRKSQKPLDYFLNLLKEKGIDACLKEIDPFCAAFVVEILQMLRETNEMSIVDFGGNHTAYFDEASINKTINELKYFKNTILLLPSADKEKSFTYFEKVIKDPITLELNKKIYEAPSNDLFASKTFYTEGLSEDDLFEQIDTYLNTTNDLKRVKAPELGRALQIRRTANKHFPGAYNIE